MLFMTIYTYEPGQRNEIVKRRLERGTVVPEGVKVIGEWSYIGGGRGFMVLEAQDPKVIMATTLAWSDLIKFETLPVMETEEVMKLVKKASSALPGVEMKL
jgi:uncharacterized protein with GYD domain